MWGCARGKLSVGWVGWVLLHARRLSVPPSISLRTNGQPSWVLADAVRAGRTGWGRAAGGNATVLVGRRSGFRLGGRNDGLGARVCCKWWGYLLP